VDKTTEGVVTFVFPQLKALTRHKVEPLNACVLTLLCWQMIRKRVFQQVC